MSTHVSRPRSSRRGLRRLSLASVLASAPVLALVAAPARADVPKGWGGEEVHYAPDALHALGLYLGAPLALFIVIGVLIYLPAMVRGEKLLPQHDAVDGTGQWIGGPRQGIAELPAADGEDSRAGGASGRW
ncbi:hypothetical protein EUA93_13245 [Nocardioides oleivorans]|uniref:Uncharacterized protein n=1 Tax=Nocardioides oleivorans TaxID=273676 RepID=A0A4Q2S162_9ACTN|nr:hypothetical protein [Nocardioides oleivorans]RYB95218.1 hypothetical protein EUA93_13245 [Nocardioides oleivorans]